jgi:hypothetical protein
MVIRSLNSESCVSLLSKVGRIGVFNAAVSAAVGTREKEERNEKRDAQGQGQELYFVERAH